MRRVIQDPHRGQFATRMQRVVNGQPVGCEACHTNKIWTELSRFDHSQTEFPLAGAHRAVACIDCHKPPTWRPSSPMLISMPRQSNVKTATRTSTVRNSRKREALPAAPNVTTAPAGSRHSSTTTTGGLPVCEEAHRNARCADCHKLNRVINGKSCTFLQADPERVLRLSWRKYSGEQAGPILGVDEEDTRVCRLDPGNH